MRPLLEDFLNLKILELICAGEGTEVNTSALAKIFGRHRNTIRKKISRFYEHKIVEPPLCPFIQLFDELPLLIIEKDHFSRDLKTKTFIEKDPAIWAAFFVKEKDYNTVLIEFHKDLYDYMKWREEIIGEGKIASGEAFYPSETIFLSTKGLIKYDYAVSIQIVEQNYKNGRHTRLNGMLIDDFTLNLLKHLLHGKGIKINENYLGRQLDVHRRTIKRRIERFLEENIILPPTCRFPRVLAPPGYVLVFSLLEIRKKKDLILKTLKSDPHFPVIIKTGTGKYNLVTFSTFYKIEDFLEWVEEFDQMFPGCIGAIENTYLSPEMTFSIAQNYVSLLYIQTAIDRLNNNVMMNPVLVN